MDSSAFYKESQALGYDSVAVALRPAYLALEFANYFQMEGIEGFYESRFGKHYKLLERFLAANEFNGLAVNLSKFHQNLQGMGFPDSDHPIWDISDQLKEDISKAVELELPKVYQVVEALVAELNQEDLEIV